MPEPSSEKVAVAGLARFAAGVLWACGGIAAAKGVWDCFIGEPEANFFSPQPWMFVTRAAWFRWASFELAFGAACAGLGQAAWVLARRLPPWIERPISGA